MDEWLINLNINKCKVVSYGGNGDHNYSDHANNVQLGQSSSIKTMGVNFVLQLKFYKHIDDKINKAYSFLGMIKRHFIKSHTFVEFPTSH